MDGNYRISTTYYGEQDTNLDGQLAKLAERHAGNRYSSAHFTRGKGERVLEFSFPNDLAREEFRQAAQRIPGVVVEW